jgi:hypothetical protein
MDYTVNNTGIQVFKYQNTKIIVDNKNNTSIISLIRGGLSVD